MGLQWLFDWGKRDGIRYILIINPYNTFNNDRKGTIY